MTWLRALAAAGLSVFLPGAGHALIRDWIRALVFSGLFLSSLVIFLPIDQIISAGSIADSMALIDEESSTIDRFVLSFIVLFAVIDATFRAMGFPPESTADDGDGPSCPVCGKPLDEELTFCHWCTTELDELDPAETEDDHSNP